TTMTGDGEGYARVVTQQDTDQWARAGIMIRASLDADAPYALVSLTPRNGVSFDHRQVASSGAAYAAGACGLEPYWVRMTRQGNVLSVYRSSNGTTWVSVDSVTIETMPQTAYVGLAVASYDNAALSTVVFDGVFVTAT
ncbi:MAG: cellulose 1,4-beta-cellobiosidase, partial [Candidatus Saccharimonadales bacterium]